MLKRFFSIALAVCIVFSCFIATDFSFIEASAATNEYGLVSDVQDGQILQCFNWSFNNIKNNMSKIAAQGFSAIQTSPIQASKESTKESWSTCSNSFWVYYQPINFSIETNSRSALGTKSEFKAMCAEAEKYGIKVIVDTVFNHLANGNSGNTLNSQIPSDIKNDSSSWHTYTTNISNYSNRYDVTHYCLGGLPDLNTGYSKIQNYATSFLKECIDCGADGFRFDAAKHIETPSDSYGTGSDFWPNVLNAATSYAQSNYGFTPYYYGEMLDSTGGVDISAYTQYMSVTDNAGSNSIRNAVNSGNASGAANSAIFNGAQPKYTVQWNESHDTYCEGSSSYVSDTNLKKTWAIVGSRAEVCGMYLARPGSGSTMLGNADTTAWADKEVKAVNQFKNAFVGQSEYFASSGSIAYVERGTSGVVLVNMGGSSTSVSVTANKMASGTYIDQISGNTFTVSNGKISGNIGSTGIAVVYNADEIEIPTQAPTEVVTSAPVSGETKTVYVGVIKYITDHVPTLHYWNNNGVFGDVTLSATGETVQYAVGSDYWSNEEKTFYVYEAQIPVEATNYKTFNASTGECWAEEEIEDKDNQITLVFEYSNLYHNFTATYPVEEPSEDETQEPTIEPTEIPTEEPTETPTEKPTEVPTETEEVTQIPTQGETTHEAGYYMVGKFNGADCWGAETLTEDRKLSLNPDIDGEYILYWTFVGGDELKVAYFDGYKITDLYKPEGESTYKIGENSDKVGYCSVKFNPAGNSNWSYNYLTVKSAPTEEPTEGTSETPSEEESSEATEEPTEAPTQVELSKVSNIKTEATSATVKFTWDALSGGTAYWVYVYNENTETWICLSSTTNTTMAVYKLTADTDYKFKITACIDNKKYLKIEDADVISVHTADAIATTSITGSASATTARITWEPIEGAQKYWLYRSNYADGPYYCYASTTDSTYLVNKLRPENEYYFKVAALTYQNGFECYSNYKDSPVCGIKTGSASIIGTVLTSNTATTATITWPEYENSDMYWVKYSTTSADTNDASHWSTLEKLTDRKYTIKNLKPDTVYYLNIGARYYDPYTGKEEFIDYIPVQVRTAHSDENFITFTEESETSVTLTWSEDIPDIAKTWIYVYDFEGNRVEMASTQTNTYTFKKLVGYKDYFYELRIQDTKGRYLTITPTGGFAYE